VSGLPERPSGPPRLSSYNSLRMLAKHVKETEYRADDFLVTALGRGPLSNLWRLGFLGG
jgi:hypothetical protein